MAALCFHFRSASSFHIRNFIHYTLHGFKMTMSCVCVCVCLSMCELRGAVILCQHGGHI